MRREAGWNYIQKNGFPFPFKLNRIWFSWRYELWTRSYSIQFDMNCQHDHVPSNLTGKPSPWSYSIRFYRKFWFIFLNIILLLLKLFFSLFWFIYAYFDCVAHTIFISKAFSFNLMDELLFIEPDIHTILVLSYL